ncbi:MAG: hypothetical protein IJJ52_01830 [Lachnospiraceae bacterium]|nr:hypothetical protein [Lachnospiraceae bacterium]
MSKARKGEWGYFRSERKRRILMTVALLAIPVLILVSSYLYFGTRQNLMTVVAMVGMVPFAMSIVSTIMFFLRQSIPEEEYRSIAEHEGNLTVAYELYFTSEKQNALVDCIAICGTELVGLVTDPKTDARFAADHLTKMLRADGYRMHVHMLTDEKKFLERMDSLNAHADSLRAGLSYKPSPGYEEYGREDMIRHLALQYAL